MRNISLHCDLLWSEVRLRKMPMMHAARNNLIRGLLQRDDAKSAKQVLRRRITRVVSRAAYDLWVGWWVIFLLERSLPCSPKFLSTRGCHHGSGLSVHHNTPARPQRCRAVLSIGT